MIVHLLFSFYRNPYLAVRIGNSMSPLGAERVPAS